MTKAEKFEKAWRIAVKENDFFLVDEIYHPEYSAFLEAPEIYKSHSKHDS
mgnify:CR=1 FL=1